MTTIFALGTGAGRAAIAILRLSGPLVRSAVQSLAGDLPQPRRASLRILRSAEGEVLDQAVVLFWPGPRSYTGEDCAELHVHGGPAVLHSVGDALLTAGVRPAEPGEFTRRAFVNGKLDLLEAEGVADLVAADTEAQRLLALRQMGGAQSAAVASWAQRLRRVLAWQEALIDFPDEDLPPSVEAELLREVAGLGGELALAAQDAERGARVREGIVIAITGAPNVGKSSLINALAQRDVAITSPIPGTTRDALEAWAEIGGIGVTLVDTAGLRETTDPLEGEGVRRAYERAAGADLVLHVVDTAQESVGLQDARTFRVVNKIDLAPAPAGSLGVSALTGEGMASLREALRDKVVRLTELGGSPVFSRARHRAALVEAASCLSRAMAFNLPELRGEELRLAMRAVGRITGEVGVEDVLDTIFASFCIGK